MNKAEKILEETMAENFLHLMKKLAYRSMNHSKFKAEKIQIKSDVSRSVKLIIDKGKIFKALRENKTHYIQKNKV